MNRPESTALLSSLVGPIMLAGLVTTAHAQPSSTVRSGFWADPTTWDNGVPNINLSANLSHNILYGLNSDIAASNLRIGRDADASLTNLESADLVVGDSASVGLNGFTGRLDLRDGDLDSGSISIGLAGPGFLRALDGEVNAALFDPFTPAFVIGSSSFPGTVTGGARLFSAGGIEFRANGRHNYEGFVPRSSSSLGIPVSTSNSTDIVFQPGSTVDLLFANISGADPAEVLTYASAPGAAVTGSPTVIPPIGYTLTPDTSDPTRLQFVVATVPSTFNWTNPGVGSWTSPGDWDLAMSPIEGGFVNVDNGGTVTFDGSTAPGGAVTRLRLNDLDVGKTAGGDGTVTISNIPEVLFARSVDVGSNSSAPPDQGTPAWRGSLTITDVEFLRFGGTVDVGDVWGTGTASVEAQASLLIERVQDLIINGDLDVADSRAVSALPGEIPANGTVVTSNSSATLRDIDSVFIGGDVDVGDGGAGLNADPGPMTINQNPTFIAENINTFTIEGGLDLGTSAAGSGETETVLGTAGFRSVEQLVIDGDLDFTRSAGSAGSTGVVEYDFGLNLTSTNVTVRGDLDMNSVVAIRGDNLVRSNARLFMQGSTLTIGAGDTAEIGNISLDGATPTPELTGATGNNIFSLVTLDASSFTSIDETVIGEVREGAPADENVAGFALTRSSYASAGLLSAGVASELVFEITGTTRATADLEEPSAYCAYDVPFNPALGPNAVTLNGTVIADIQFTPPIGTYSFDLISTTGSITGTPTLEVENLPQGVQVTSFGVVSEGGTDNVLRLVLTVPSPCAGDADGDGDTDLDDFSVLAVQFGTAGPGADLDGSGAVDLDDFSVLAVDFGCGA